MYIERKIDSDLASWKTDPYRKPLLIRGVRQCGKTSSIREFGKTFRYFAEINFEKTPMAKSVFEGNIDIMVICAQLEVITGIPIIDGETLLFLDEMQDCPSSIIALRYFYEDRPGLHIIGAGSLLEFALNRISSFGVGRITSFYMHPFSFREFLSALGEKILISVLDDASCALPLSEIAHQKLLSIYKAYIVVGGMPEAVLRFVETRSMLQARYVHQEILGTLLDDFGKYSDVLSPEILRDIFTFTLSRIGVQISFDKNSIPGLDHKTISTGLGILAQAGLLHIVYASKCDSLPIASCVNMRRMKLLFADTGLYLSASGLDVSSFTLETDFRKLNIGNVCELSAGLELINSMGSLYPPKLFYWKRDADGTNRGVAEIDYVIQKNSEIIPVEVKARTQGGMKSLWAFMEAKGCSFGVRASLENFGVMGSLRIYPVYGISKIYDGGF